MDFEWMLKMLGHLQNKHKNEIANRTCTFEFE